jgi:hypothetical protein
LDQPGLVVYKYWEDRPQPVRTANPDLPCIVYSVPGKVAVAVITSYAEKDEDVAVSVDARALGFTQGCIVTDAEGGAEWPLENGAMRFPLKKHDLKVLRFLPGGIK